MSCAVNITVACKNARPKKYVRKLRHTDLDTPLAVSVYLTPRQRDWLERKAQRRSFDDRLFVSMSRVIRDLIDKEMVE